jgi:hypothetical protein
VATRKPAPDLLGSVEAAIFCLCVALVERCEAVVELLLDTEEDPSFPAVQEAARFSERVERVLPHSFSGTNRYNGLWHRAFQVREELRDVLLTAAVDA